MIEGRIMKSYREYMEDVSNGIAPPDYIPSGGEDFCDICGGTVTWPPTGEPCEGVCNDNCDDKIKEAWIQYKLTTKIL